MFEATKNEGQLIKRVMEAVKELVNDGWIIIVLKKTGKGSDEHVSLNQRKVQEIQQFMNQI